MIVFDKRLKNCPLCGGDCYYEEKCFGGAIRVINVKCKECGLEGHKNFLISSKNHLEKTIEYWNRRCVN